MNEAKKHILLCGKRRSGRSAMIRKLTQDLTVPLYGYMTRRLGTNSRGYHEIFMFPYGSVDLTPSEHCHIGDCNTREREINNDVFNHLGTELMKANPDGILVLDEIGFMESGAKDFCDAVLRALDGEIHVLAAVRTGVESPFVRRVLASEKALVCEMLPEQFDERFLELKPIVDRWERDILTC